MVSASYNIAPSSDIPAVVASDDTSRRLQLMHWGLVPHWAKERSTRYSMINAKAETISEKPAYKQAFLQRRCLIPADGFYEWRNENNIKQPYYICRKDRELMVFAGIWELWRGDHELYSCAIITTASNHDLHALHERMPVILDPEQYADWLDPARREPEKLQHFLGPYRENQLEYFPVSRDVNTPRNNHPGLIQPIH